jgi:tetratricopeptide (TPR) repeat protein
MGKKTCFVIQGFGKKTDYQTGRTLDLDASYEVIKEAVVDAGLECIRADEIKHSGTIDQPMFDQILAADLVIADLSTYNVNAAYSLGVRHALRPSSTIIVAETNFKYPFDFSHIAIRTYKHWGEDLGTREAIRFRDDLRQAIEAILAAQKTDSPVYTFLPDLEPPRRRPGVGGLGTGGQAGVGGLGTPGLGTKGRVDEAKAAIANGQYGTAKQILTELFTLTPNDESIIQLLALATFKTEDPTREEALIKARRYLEPLDPAWSHDTETLRLWAELHERLWENDRDPENLDAAIDGYERAFQLSQDYRKGLTFAYLLDMRAQSSKTLESIGDHVLACRVRRRVVDICGRILKKRDVGEGENVALEPERAAQQRDIFFALREASVGLGKAEEAEHWRRKALEAKPDPSVIEATDRQIRKLRGLLAKLPIDKEGIETPGANYEPDEARKTSSGRAIGGHGERARVDLDADEGERKSAAAARDIFISYAHDDRDWLSELKKHLAPYARKGSINVWDDTMIRAGSKCERDIETALQLAKVAILLVSPAFLESDFIARKEFPPLLQAAESQGLKILWIPVSESSYFETEIGAYQAVHEPERPLDSLAPSERNAAFVRICRKIKEEMGARA